MKDNNVILPEEVIINKILLIRGQKVMVDYDLALLYGVPTKRLNEQVKRNIKRFPEHFMFKLNEKEKSELVANCDHLKKLKHSPYLPCVFTEYGVLQLANVLNSERAINVGNRIIEIFVKMREVLAARNDIIKKLEELERNDIEQDKKILLIFEYLKQFELAKQEQLDIKERKRIGFRQQSKK